MISRIVLCRRLLLLNVRRDHDDERERIFISPCCSVGSGARAEAWGEAFRFKYLARRGPSKCRAGRADLVLFSPRSRPFRPSPSRHPSPPSLHHAPLPWTRPALEAGRQGQGCPEGLHGHPGPARRPALGRRPRDGRPPAEGPRRRSVHLLFGPPLRSDSGGAAARAFSRWAERPGRVVMGRDKPCSIGTDGLAARAADGRAELAHRAARPAEKHLTCHCTSSSHSGASRALAQPSRSLGVLSHTSSTESGRWNHSEARGDRSAGRRGARRERGLATALPSPPLSCRSFPLRACLATLTQIAFVVCACS